MVGLDQGLFGMQPHKFGGYVTPPIKLRAFSSQDDERTHPEIPNGVVGVALGAAAAAAAGVARSRGATNVCVHVGQQLAAVESARVLRLSDAEGAFSGWVSEAREARQFVTLTEYYVHRGAWCCSSRNQAQQDDGRVYVRRPPELRVP